MKKTCETCGQPIPIRIPARAPIDDTTRQWLKSHGYPYPYINRISQHLYGADLGAALDRLQGAHVGPHGTTKQAARRELVRMINAVEQFAALSDIFGGRA